MARFVALLRAVNVGGTGIVTMQDVRRMFDRLGLSDVATVGASGNVLFGARGAAPALRRRIEEALSKLLGKPATVLVRSSEELQAVVAGAPFRAGTDEKTYVAFLAEPVGAKAPSRMPGLDVRFPSPRESEVYVVAARSTPPGTDVGAFLTKALGKVQVTLRAWTVVQALAQKAGGA